MIDHDHYEFPWFLLAADYLLQLACHYLMLRIFNSTIFRVDVLVAGCMGGWHGLIWFPKLLSSIEKSPRCVDEEYEVEVVMISRTLSLYNNVCSV